MGTTAQKLQAVVNSKAAIKAAIEAKGVADVGDVLSTYAEKIASISSGGWTGHADEVGLKAIGWTDEDIAYYQKYGVNWNEEDDAYHKVPQENIDLYGSISAGNVPSYSDRLIYLPKIDTSRLTRLDYTFQDCNLLVAIPMLNTSKVTSMEYTFGSCSSLVSIPLLDTSKVTDMSYMFYGCSSLVDLPQLDTSSVTNMSNAFRSCSNLVHLPQLDTSSVTNMSSAFSSCGNLVNLPQLITAQVTDMNQMLGFCRNLVSVTGIDLLGASDIDRIFVYSYRIKDCYIKNLKLSIEISETSFLEKDSLLYMIENATPTSTIYITLSSYCYNKFRNDPDVVAALSAQPLIKLSYS